MRHVLHTVDTWGPGGAETVCVELAAGIDPRRFHSHAVAIREGWVHDAFLARGLDTTIVRTGRGPIDTGYLWRLAALARRQRIALIQSHLLTANLYCGMAARLLGIPAVATFHGMVDVDPDDRWASVKMTLITRNVTRLVFVSEALRRHFLARHARLDERSTVIHNGVDASLFRPAPNGDLRARLGVGAEAIIVAAVGNVRPAKGYEDLLRTAALLRTTAPDIRFVIVGEMTEPLHGTLVTRRRELGLEDRVTFLGFRDDVAHVLNGADIYLNCSTSEGFSLTTIQAMACGVPVLATRSGGPEEIIKDGADGALVNVGDVAAMATVLAALSHETDLRGRLGGAGRATVLERFSIDRMIASYESVYEHAMERRR